ncbi:hypothetical protein MRI28_04250 [Nocardiopsis dassonvillei]|uniref:hypothetical protein n=1 Tax=Nocardiopsis dassonvillei TaxID=2014 RepID=UPI00200E3B37|nr:hypothetical protein [Nocardiopsis dassonvillei]MCK9868868.1 hypothetical protein [Nocardiopsis dassonvillei]
MVSHDIYAALAAILHPMPPTPPREEFSSDADYEFYMKGHQAHLEMVARDREQTAEDLQISAEEVEEDPVLRALAEQRAVKEEAEAKIRMLIAYAREFTVPRPYTLAGLANAAGFKSPSGVRTSYDLRTAAEVADRTGLKPRNWQADGSTPTGS